MARLIIPAKNLIARTNRQKASAPIIPGLSLPGNIREGRSWVRWRGAVKAARPRHRLIRRQTSHCEEFGEAARQGFCGSTATALDGSGIARKLADCRQPSGSATPRKAEARRGAGLATGLRPEKTCLWQDELLRNFTGASSGE